MEIIKTNSDLLDKPVIKQSFRKANQSNVIDNEDCKPWAVDGVAFPHGTKLRGKYKGYVYQGKVDNGALILNGKKFLSPCAAAVTITRDAVDGWLFWDCKIPGRSSWESLYEFKNA